MTLFELICQLDQLDDEWVIYAVREDGKWTPGSKAVALPEPEDSNVDQVFEGVPMRYVLEVSLAREVIDVFQEHHGTRTPSDEERYQAVLYYAEYDCYLP